jgi:hypothetical protein
MNSLPQDVLVKILELACAESSDLRTPAALECTSRSLRQAMHRIPRTSLDFGLDVHSGKRLGWMWRGGWLARRAGEVAGLRVEGGTADVLAVARQFPGVLDLSIEHEDYDSDDSDGLDLHGSLPEGLRALHVYTDGALAMPASMPRLERLDIQAGRFDLGFLRGAPALRTLHLGEYVDLRLSPGDLEALAASGVRHLTMPRAAFLEDQFLVLPPGLLSADLGNMSRAGFREETFGIVHNLQTLVMPRRMGRTVELPRAVWNSLRELKINAYCCIEAVPESPLRRTDRGMALTLLAKTRPGRNIRRDSLTRALHKIEGRVGSITGVVFSDEPATLEQYRGVLAEACPAARLELVVVRPTYSLTLA